MSSIMPSESTLERDLCRRMAARLDLSFYIIHNQVVSNDYSEPSREATEVELEMWGHLISTLKHGITTAHVNEFNNFYGPGPYYINEHDWYIMSRHPNYSRDQASRIDKINGAMVLIRDIPKGYYLNMGHLHPAFRWSLLRDLTDEQVDIVRDALQPLLATR